MKDNEKLSGCLMLFILCGMGIFFAQTPLNTQYKLIIEPTLNPTRSVSQEIQLSGVTVEEAENNRGQLEADIAASQGRAAEDVEAQWRQRVNGLSVILLSCCRRRTASDRRPLVVDEAF